MKKKVIYRTVFQFEVLSEEPVDVSMSFIDIVRECNEGDFSGSEKVIIHNEPVVGKKAANLVQKQGSDPEFFGMDKNGNEIEL